MRHIDGEKLKGAIKRKGLSQKAVSNRAGLSYFRLSRICQPGLHVVHRGTASSIAKAIGIDEECFAIDSTKAMMQAARNDPMDAYEEELVRLFRALSVPDRVAAIAELQKLASADG